MNDALLIVTVVAVVTFLAVFLTNVWLMKQQNRLLPGTTLDRSVREEMVRRLAREYHASPDYVRRLLAMTDRYDNGQLTNLQFTQFTHRLGEEYPEDYAHMKEYYRTKPLLAPEEEA